MPVLFRLFQDIPFMQITKDAVVTIDYTLRNEGGEVIESSEGRAPLAYIHGIGNIIPGLESALEGKAAGDEVSVNVAPADAYGERVDDLVQAVPKQMFQSEVEPQVGMQFQAMSESGPRVVTVVSVEDETVTVDGNHPLAGMALNFDVKIVEVREATGEELEHGHVHGEGGHEH